ncbi:MAG: serine protease [Lachnospiraceae bacterium]|nr:serine protease [Lachnospiraceae bacterium]
MEIINILGIIVLLVGIVLIGVEFFMPGFGLPGISGIICVAAGIYLTGRNATERLTVGVIAIVVIAVLLVISIIVFKSKKVKSPIKLETDLPGKNLFIDESDMNYLVGKKGTALTDLRPSGKGEFEGVKLDVLSAGEFIEKDKKLIIIEIKNNKIFVRKGE